MAESSGPGDSRSIENPTDPSDMPEELEQAVRSDADREPIKGKAVDRPGSDRAEPRSGEHGLTTEEGVNEPGTRADQD